LEALGKPGVGLLFDLGSDRDVERIRLRTDTPGYALEIRAGPNVPDDESSLEVVARAGEVRPSSVLQAKGAGRYWLVWITSLPGGGGGSAQVAEVEFFGS
jgi:putative peptidoglycan lipid II flippase